MRDKKLLKMIKSELDNTFGDLIVKVVLFGSRVDLSARKDSDYDVLIILKEKIDWRGKDRILDIIAELNLKHDVIIDAHIISESELHTIKGKQPYIQNALDSGLAV
jgi:predicted nucleotidyltransferase